MESRLHAARRHAPTRAVQTSFHLVKARPARASGKRASRALLPRARPAQLTPTLFHLVDWVGAITVTSAQDAHTCDVSSQSHPASRELVRSDVTWAMRHGGKASEGCCTSHGVVRSVPHASKGSTTRPAVCDGNVKRRLALSTHLERKRSARHARVRARHARVRVTREWLLQPST